MEKEGFVSIWFGNMKSQEFLERYVNLIYDEDGECKPSIFLTDFEIDMDEIDEDFIEKANYNFISDKVDKLIKGCSYSDKVIPRICKEIGDKINEKVNTVILVYNFYYSGKIININKQEYNIKYYGVVSYR
ncbi:immunity 22 family protein [Defluviitalea phaphyphila]|uniref:immunity 22 family protein n=1 Tax=Defluviitalea phaphyphila TaxID=1473580 RepID=UPI000731E230|nr:immunity 22 family protein [Defluviitalea phaphyphila]